MKQRKHIDCRSYPSDMNCTISISADSDKELLEAAVQHAVAVHGHKDTRTAQDIADHAERRRGAGIAVIKYSPQMALLYRLRYAV